MTDEPERDLGEQPIGAIMAERGIKARDLVLATEDQITFKMVSRACKGRRLTPHVQLKIRSALSAAAGEEFALGQLFNY